MPSHAENMAKGKKKQPHIKRDCFKMRSEKEQEIPSLHIKNYAGAHLHNSLWRLPKHP